MNIWDPIHRSSVTPQSLRSDLRGLPVNLSLKLEGRQKELDYAYEQFQWILGWAEPELDLEALREILKLAVKADEELNQSLITITERFNETSRKAFAAIYRNRHKRGYALYPIDPSPPVGRNEQVSQAYRPDRVADVVFLHGLDGNAFETWCHDPRRLRDSWPYWLAAELENVGVWSLGYSAASSIHRGNALPLISMAQAAIDTLDLEGNIGDRPLVFIVHSLGGLIIKQIINLGLTSPSNNGKRIADAFAGVAFIATPHDGSFVGSIADRLAVFYGTTKIVEALRKNNEQTLYLKDWFAGHMANYKNIIIQVYRETEPFKGVMIVEKSSAHPGISHGEVFDVPGQNHATICKCRNRSDLVYGNIKRMIKRIVSRSSRSAG